MILHKLRPSGIQYFHCQEIYHPTGHFTILELHIPLIDESAQSKIRRLSDFEALKFRKGQSGIWFIFIFRKRGSTIFVTLILQIVRSGSRGQYNSKCSVTKHLIRFWRFLLFQHPTSPFIIFQSHGQEIGEFYVVQERRTTDVEAPKL